jgi:hypothetical protein
VLASHDTAAYPVERPLQSPITGCRGSRSARSATPPSCARIELRGARRSRSLTIVPCVSPALGLARIRAERRGVLAHGLPQNTWSRPSPRTGNEMSPRGTGADPTIQFSVRLAQRPKQHPIAPVVSPSAGVPGADPITHPTCAFRRRVPRDTRSRRALLYKVSPALRDGLGLALRKSLSTSAQRQIGSDVKGASQQ